MDEKTTRIIRCRVYIGFAVVAVVMMAFVLTATTHRVAMGVLTAYCLGMAYYNYRKAKEEEGKKK